MFFVLIDNGIIQVLYRRQDISPKVRNHLEIPVEIGGDGQIKEWKEETSYNTDANGKTLGDPVHRHISHLVGLYIPATSCKSYFIPSSVGPCSGERPSQVV